jgi:hypothetical protein
LSMPHPSVAILSAGLAVGGLAGVTYSSYIGARLRRHFSAGPYVPVLEDWLWNVIVPTLVYACLLGMAVLLWYQPIRALYVVAALSLTMLFIGIRNAWDIAVWMTLHRTGGSD